MKHAKKWLSLILAFIMTAGTPLSALAAWEDGLIIPGQGSSGSSGYDDLFWEYTDDGLSISFHTLIDLVFKLAIGLNNQCTAGFCNVMTLIADGLPTSQETLAGIDQLHLAPAVLRLVLVDDPNIGGNTGVIERIVGQLNNSI